MRDYPPVSAVNLLFAIAVMAVNLAIDLIYPYLDPAGALPVKRQ